MVSFFILLRLVKKLCLFAGSVVALLLFVAICPCCYFRDAETLEHDVIAFVVGVLLVQQTYMPVVHHHHCRIACCAVGYLQRLYPSFAESVGSGIVLTAFYYLIIETHCAAFRTLYYRLQ